MSFPHPRFNATKRKAAEKRIVIRTPPLVATISYALSLPPPSRSICDVPGLLSNVFCDKLALGGSLLGLTMQKGFGLSSEGPLVLLMLTLGCRKEGVPAVCGEGSN